MDIATLKARAVGAPEMKVVRVDFTEEEMAARRVDLAQARLNLDDENKTFAILRTAHNTVRKELEAESATILDDIRRQYVDVAKEVLLVPDYDANTMYIYRADNGDLVESRRLRPDERQTAMAV